MSYEPLILKPSRLKAIRHLLDQTLDQYYHHGFIQDDPISIPHQFSKKQDIEIMGFWIATLSWGNRKSIINSGKKLMDLMDGDPHQFILHHTENDRLRFNSFKHRTFQPDDAIYFVHFLQWYYSQHDSLEDAFIDVNKSNNPVESGLINFQNIFTSLPEFLPRTKKHVSSPKSASACKRLNMFLRWMIRKDDRHVDFGIWDKISASDLYIPLDVHVFNVAQKLELTSYTKPNWKTVQQITDVLRQIDPDDPIKYDYALFSLGVNERSP